MMIPRATVESMPAPRNIVTILKGSLAGADDPFALHLYWSLYLGVISFWIRDESSKQEDTLALLDRSIRLFVNSLNNSEYTNHGA